MYYWASFLCQKLLSDHAAEKKLKAAEKSFIVYSMMYQK